MLHDLLLLAGVFFMTWLGHFVFARANSKTDNSGPKVIDAADRFLVKKKSQGYAKPNGKHKPKLNDDFNAWKKENDLPRDD